MKHLALALLLLFGMSLMAQNNGTISIPFNSETGKYGYDTTIVIPGTKAEISKAAKSFTSRKFMTNNFIISDENELLLKGHVPATMTKPLVMTYNITFSINILSNDGKLRLKISDMIVGTNSSQSGPEITLEDFFKNNASVSKAGRIMNESLSLSINENITSLIQEYKDITTKK